MIKLIFILAIVAALTFFYFSRKKGAGQSDSPAQGDPALSAPEDKSALKNITTYIDEKDSGFSVPEFTEKISNLYIRLCNALEDKNTLTVKPYFADDIISSYDKEIEEDRNSGYTHIFSKLTVLSATVNGWKSDGDSDIIVAEIRSRMTDYKEDSQGNPVGGGMNTEKFITSEWILERSASKKTGNDDSLNAQNCPYCGAPVNINSSAVCEYCGRVLKTDNFDWVVKRIKSIERTEVNI